MIAALFVETGGAYFGLPNVDPWDEARDARLYDGPWPVVAHPPCARHIYRHGRIGERCRCHDHREEQAMSKRKKGLSDLPMDKRRRLDQACVKIARAALAKA